jgi:glycosyltransferase involved in cell wall biosynthesis
MTRTIVHILNGLRFGGLETHCLQLLRRAPSDVRSVVINLAPQHVENSRPFRELAGVDVYSLRYAPAHRVLFVQSLASMLQRLSADAVLSHPFGLHVLVAAAARMSGTRPFTHVANPPPHGDASALKTYRAIAAATLSLGCPILFCSDFLLEDYERNVAPAPGGSQVIHYGCDTERIAQRAANARAQRRDDVPTLGMVARLNEIKDQATLIVALPLIRASVPRAFAAR